MKSQILYHFIYKYFRKKGSFKKQTNQAVLVGLCCSWPWRQEVREPSEGYSGCRGMGSSRGLTPPASAQVISPSACFMRFRWVSGLWVPVSNYSQRSPLRWPISSFLSLSPSCNWHHHAYNPSGSEIRTPSWDSSLCSLVPSPSRPISEQAAKKGSIVKRLKAPLPPLSARGRRVGSSLGTLPGHTSIHMTSLWDCAVHTCML